VFLVLRSSSSKPNPHKKTIQSKQKPAKSTRPKQKPAKKSTSNRSKAGFRKTSKRSPAKTLVEGKRDQQEGAQVIKKISRPEDEVVTYTGIDFQFRELIPSGRQVLVGPSSLTRFEKARITGARSLQLSLGAPPLMKIPQEIKDSVSLATLELNAKALPISIRRVLPNGMYQDIPATWLK
jgi:DNA-directed RNA polymerases I, II, and III subunit RPABC2